MINPLQWSVSSRPRLIFATVVSSLILYSVGYVITGYIRDTSDSVTVDLLLMTGVMTLLLGASFIGALLVSSVVFGERWVKHLILGQGREDDSMDAILSPAQNRPIRLSFVLLAVAIPHLMVLEYAITSEFYGYYQDKGRLETLLRSPDSAIRESALIEMSDEQGPLLQDYTLEMVIPLLHSEDPILRQQALAAVAYVGERMNYSLDLTNRGLSVPAGWEVKFLLRLRKEVIPLVEELGKSDSDTSTRALAMETLGSLRSRSSLSLIDDVLNNPKTTKDVRRGALVGLTQMKGRLSAVPVVVRALAKYPPDSREAGIAVYALGEIVGFWTPSEREEMEPPQEVSDALTALTERLLVLSPGNQCIAADAIRKMRNRDAREPLFTYFENTQTNFDCQEDTLDRDRRTALSLSEREHIRIRTLRAIAYIAKNPGTEKNDLYSNEVVRWLRVQQTRNDRYSEEIIRELKNVDEMTNPSVGPADTKDTKNPKSGCVNSPVRGGSPRIILFGTALFLLLGIQHFRWSVRQGREP